MERRTAGIIGRLRTATAVLALVLLASACGEAPLMPGDGGTADSAEKVQLVGRVAVTGYVGDVAVRVHRIDGLTVGPRLGQDVTDAKGSFFIDLVDPSVCLLLVAGGKGAAGGKAEYWDPASATTWKLEN